jgi:hypothetical protein
VIEPLAVVNTDDRCIARRMAPNGEHLRHSSSDAQRRQSDHLAKAARVPSRGSAPDRAAGLRSEEDVLAERVS